MHGSRGRVSQLLSLLQELSERISSSDIENESVLLDDEDPVQIRFRVLLTGLLETFFVTPIQMKMERDILAILKLITHTSKQFPGVFYHGRAVAILPVLAHIFPLFAEIKFKHHSHIMVDALVGLFSLLRNHQTLIYNLIVMGISRLLIDASPLTTSISDSSPNQSYSSVCVTAFPEAFKTVFEGSDTKYSRQNKELNGDKESQRQVDSTLTPFAAGIIIDVSDEDRWTSLVCCTIRLMNSILKLEKNIHIFQLIHPDTFSAIGAYLNYPCSFLHKACFDLICTALPFTHPNTIPLHKLMLSLICILNIQGEDEYSLPSFRDYEYDCKLGSCLYALCHSSSSSDCFLPNSSQDSPLHSLMLVSQPFINLFPSTLLSTSCTELRISLCKSLHIILKTLSNLVFSVSCLFPVLCIPETGPILSSCISSVLENQYPFKLRKSWDSATCHDVDVAFSAQPNKIQAHGIPHTSIKFKKQNNQHLNLKSKLDYDFDPCQKISYDQLVRMSIDYFHKNDKQSSSSSSSPSSSSNFDDIMNTEPYPLNSDDDRSIRDEDNQLFDELRNFISNLNPPSIEVVDTDNALEKVFELNVISDAFKKFQACECHTLMLHAFTQWMNWVSENHTIIDISCKHMTCMMNIMNNLFTETDGSINLEKARLCDFATTQFVLKPWKVKAIGDENIYNSFKIKIFHFLSHQSHCMDEKICQTIIGYGLKESDNCVRIASMFTILNMFNACTNERKIEYHHTLCSMVNDNSSEICMYALLILGYMHCLNEFSTITAPSPSSTPSQSPLISIDLAMASHSNDITAPPHPFPSSSPFNSKLDQICQFFKCEICDNTALSCSNNEKSNGSDTETVNSSICILSPPSFNSLFKVVMDENSADDVKLAWLKTLPRFLNHSSSEHLIKNRQPLISSLEIFPIHPCLQIRVAFNHILLSLANSRILQILFSDHMERDSKFIDGINYEFNGFDSYLVCLLRIMQRHLLSDSFFSFYDTILDSIAVIAEARKTKQLSFLCFALLIEQLDLNIFPIRVAIVCTIERFASQFQKHAPMNDSDPIKFIIQTFKSDLFEYLSFCLLNKPHIVKEFASCIMHCSYEDLIVQMLPLIIPKLVLSASKSLGSDDESMHSQSENNALSTLHNIANLTKTSVALLLLEWCPFILAHAFLNSDGNELLSILQFIHSQTLLEPSSLFSAALPSLLYQLFVSLGDPEPNPEVLAQRVKQIFPMIQEVSRILTNSDDLSSFLKEHLVGLLNNIDLKLLKGNDVAKQLHALNCIGHLIQMIGCHLSTFVPKFIALLTFSFRFPHLHAKCLSVWLTLIQSMADVAPSSLKSFTRQIVVSLFPCFTGSDFSEEEITAAVKVLDELLVKNKGLVEEKIIEIPCLPTHPATIHLSSALKESKDALSLHQKVKYCIEGLMHESMTIRLATANELKALLRNCREEINSIIMKCAEGDDVDMLNHLIQALLRGCSEDARMMINEDIKLICAECLGEIGAVDPSRVHVSFCSDPLMDKNVDGLVVELISSHLCKVLRSASEPGVQDSAALAIQELLKSSGVRYALSNSSSLYLTVIENSQELEISSSQNKKPRIVPVVDEKDAAKTKRGQRIWSMLSDEVKEMIQPFLTSNFTLKIIPLDYPEGPVFKPNILCRRWLYLWYMKLISESKGPLSDVFHSCRGIIGHNMQTVLFLIKYLVWNVICFGSNQAQESVKLEILTVLSASDFFFAKDRSPNFLSSSLSESSIQVIFTILDFLDKWSDDFRARNLKSATGTDPHKVCTVPNVLLWEESDTNAEQAVRHMESLLESIPKQSIAKASFRCQSYARALQYFEDHIRETTGSINPAAANCGYLKDEDIAFLIDIYSGLDEMDGMIGLSHLSNSMNLDVQLAMHEKAGKYSEALTYYEQILEAEPANSSRQLGLLQCLLKMGHLRALVTHVDGLLFRYPTHRKEWSSCGMQAAWRLGEWDRLDEYITIVDSTDVGSHLASSDPIADPPSAGEFAEFDVGLSRIIQSMCQNNKRRFSEQIAMTRKSLLHPLSAAAMESYSRSYPLLVKLHMLRELEDLCDLGIWKGDSSPSRLEDINTKRSEIVSDWERRLSITQPSLETRESISSLHRLLYDKMGMKNETGMLWLHYAKLCRRLGHYQTANRANLEARAHSAEGVRLEVAKLFWATNDQQRAISELQEAVQLSPVNVSESISMVQTKPVSTSEHALVLETTERLDEGIVLDKEIRGKVKSPIILMGKMLLQLARWVHESRGKHKQDVIAMYRRVQEVRPNWDKSFFYLAKFYDDLLTDARKRQEDESKSTAETSGKTRNLSGLKRAHSKGLMEDEKKWWMYIPSAMFHYGNALSLGSKYLYYAMPRILTLWFEFCAIFLSSTSKKHNVQMYYERAFIYMRQFKVVLSTSQWLSSLPQLVSRICHPNEEVVNLLKEIILLVLRSHPHQTLWTMAAVCKSKHANRKAVASEIIDSARESSNSMEERELYIQFPLFVDHMIKLCNFGRGAEKTPNTLSASKDFSTLKRMMPVNIMMPTQSAMTTVHPTRGDSSFDAADSPCLITKHSNPLTICRINEEINVMNSLQKPKKVVFLGSDGSHYGFLCKPKDDLRKDARMMEFTSMLNRLFSKDAESRKWKLYIRTFAVLPLTEDCGMVEWVNNTRGLRHILQELYMSTGKYDWPRTNGKIKQYFEKCKSEDLKGEMLKSQVLPLFPPIFNRWFVSSFPEPAAWFKARKSFCHTVAVWSMVGHVVGLGDRHGENILLDSMNGDCVHVDFSCLFDKGLLLQRPEVVPFRLTQNMVDGLGVTGCEGLFMRVCVTVLSVFRMNREGLMTVLETLIHDPLVEWEKSHKATGTEVHNFQGKKALANIDARLKGVVVGVGAAPSLPLSVQGQVTRLIKEAVSISNLGRMYIWWMPWF